MNGAPGKPRDGGSPATGRTLKCFSSHLGSNAGRQRFPKITGQAAHLHAHLSLSDIARGLGLSASRVGRVVSKQAKGKT
jgi:hypothetical protein